MPFAQSFYAEQKPAAKPQDAASLAAAAVPATTPIAEDPLSPAQIQEAIRVYRSVLSASAPSSPVQQAPVVPEKPTVHSNYYGGGPTDIPQSYLVNYKCSPAAAPPSPAVEPQAPIAPELTEEEQLIARLQAIRLQKQEAAASLPAPVPVEPTYTQKVVPKKAPLAQRMYDDEESGYCFNRKKNADQEEVEDVQQEDVQEYVAPAPQVTAPQDHFIAAPPVATNYSRTISGPSEYIGMANDNKFIYDAQKSVPVSYTQNHSYTLVNSAPQAVIVRPEEPEEHGTTTTEDVTQVPASPAVTSRFRGIIQKAQTPIQATAPIVVERVGEQSFQSPYKNNAYGAFMPVNQMSMESEYQLPVLNDLASCIEHY